MFLRRFGVSVSRHCAQLKFVVGDIGNVGELEQSTPQLEFANQIWTYMSSHLLVHLLYYYETGTR